MEKKVLAKKIRTFGGWYKHEPIFHGNEKIGFLQTTSKGQRTTHSSKGGAIHGHNVSWLQKKWLQE